MDGWIILDTQFTSGFWTRRNRVGDLGMDIDGREGEVRELNEVDNRIHVISFPTDSELDQSAGPFRTSEVFSWRISVVHLRRWMLDG